MRLTFAEGELERAGWELREQFTASGRTPTHLVLSGEGNRPSLYATSDSMYVFILATLSPSGGACSTLTVLSLLSDVDQERLRVACEADWLR